MAVVALNRRFVENGMKRNFQAPRCTARSVSEKGVGAGRVLLWHRVVILAGAEQQQNGEK